MDQYTKLDATGAALPKESEDWVAVRDNNLRLIDGEYRHLVWPRHESTKRYSHKDAIAAAAAVTVGGWTDWRLPTVEELATLPDRSRFNPAIDTDYFSSNGAWFWSSTADASDPAYAWLVHFYNGYVGYGPRSDSGFVRACRSVPPSQ